MLALARLRGAAAVCYTIESLPLVWLECLSVQKHLTGIGET
jgi:hypothetical protein